MAITVICVRFHSSLQIPPRTCIFQLILLAQPCSRAPLSEQWAVGEMLGGETAWHWEQGRQRKLANSGTERVQSSPRRCIHQEYTPCKHQPHGRGCLPGLAGHCAHICICSAPLSSWCVCFWAVREKMLGYVGLCSTTAWPVMCSQTNLVPVNSF